MKAIISKENLWHFQCPACEQWWAIGDYKGGAEIYCPRCHQKLEVEDGRNSDGLSFSADEAVAGLKAWNDLFPDKDSALKSLLNAICQVPPPTVKSPDTIRDEALEEAAKVVVNAKYSLNSLDNIATAIRTLKSKP